MTNEDDALVRSVTQQAREMIASGRTFSLHIYSTTSPKISRAIGHNGQIANTTLTPRQVAGLFRAMADAVEEETRASAGKKKR